MRAAGLPRGHGGWPLPALPMTARGALGVGAFLILALIPCGPIPGSARAEDQVAEGEEEAVGEEQYAAEGQAAAEGPAAAGVSGFNQTKYSIASESDDEILEEWFDLEVSYSSLLAGLRYEAFQPPQPADPLGEGVREGIAFRYAELARPWGRIRVGNFYTIFGRGLALNLFEDRDVRIDSNLDGLLAETGYHGLGLTVLTGRTRLTTTQRWPTSAPAESRHDIVHGADLTVRPLPGLLLGASYVGQRIPEPGGETRRDLTSARAEAWLGPLGLYGEHAELENETTYQGRGSYVATSVSWPGVGITAEYKDYDQFAFHSQDDRIYLNSPPALSREHSYTLFNRHPHKLDASDEKGFQVDVNLAPWPSTTAILNTSRSRTHQGGSTFEESYVEFRQLREGKGFSAFTGAAGYSEDFSTKNLTFVGETTYLLSPIYSARVEFGHQHTTSDMVGEYDDELVVLELARSPGLTAAVTAEWNNKSAAQRPAGEEKAWVMGTASFVLGEDTDLTLMYGSRQAGYYCVGGRCRFDPAFEGVEARFLTRF